jgi:broad-specificity NMP kinase
MRGWSNGGGMGVRNYLIEGVSGAGKTSVATELQRRGYHVVHGDRELAYQGDPQTGEPLCEAVLQANGRDVDFRHRHHVWNVDRVRSIVADKSRPVSFFCGGARNSGQFIGLFDAVFVLDVDLDTLERRLAGRGEDEFGGNAAERAVVFRVHATKEDIPANATTIDATAPLVLVVDDILSRCGERV